MSIYIYAYSTGPTSGNKHTLKTITVSTAGAVMVGNDTEVTLPTYNNDATVINQQIAYVSGYLYLLPGQLKPSRTLRETYGAPWYRMTASGTTIGTPALLGVSESTPPILTQGAFAAYDDSGTTRFLMGCGTRRSATSVDGNYNEVSGSYVYAYRINSAGYIVREGGDDSTNYGLQTGPAFIIPKGSHAIFVGKKSLLAYGDLNDSGKLLTKYGLSNGEYGAVSSYTGTSLALGRVGVKPKSACKPTANNYLYGQRYWTTEVGFNTYVCASSNASNTQYKTWIISSVTSTYEASGTLTLSSVPSGFTCTDIVHTVCEETSSTLVAIVCGVYNGQNTYAVFTGAFTPTTGTTLSYVSSFSAPSSVSIDGYTTGDAFAFTNTAVSVVDDSDITPPTIENLEYDATPDSHVLHIEGDILYDGDTSSVTAELVLPTLIGNKVDAVLTSITGGKHFVFQVDYSDSDDVDHPNPGNSVYYFHVVAGRTNTQGNIVAVKSADLPFRVNSKVPSITSISTISAMNYGLHIKVNLTAYDGYTPSPGPSTDGLLVTIEYADILVADGIQSGDWNTIALTSKEYSFPSTSTTPGKSQCSVAITTDDVTGGGVQDRAFYARLTNANGTVFTSDPYLYSLDTGVSSSLTIVVDNLPCDFSSPDGTNTIHGTTLGSSGVTRDLQLEVKYRQKWYNIKSLPFTTASAGFSFTEDDIGYEIQASQIPAGTYTYSGSLENGLYGYRLTLTDGVNSTIESGTFFIDRAYPDFATTLQSSNATQYPEFTVTLKDYIPDLEYTSPLRVGGSGIDTTTSSSDRGLSVWFYDTGLGDYVDRTNAYTLSKTIVQPIGETDYGYEVQYAMQITDELVASNRMPNPCNAIRFDYSNRCGVGYSTEIPVYVYVGVPPTVEDIELYQSFE